MGFDPFDPGSIFRDEPTVPAPTIPEPTETETAIQEEILELLREGPQERELTEVEQKLQDLTLESLEAQMEALPEEKAFRQEQLTLMRQQAEFQAEQIKRLQEARDMGEITGDLSTEELDNLNRLEANAVQQMTTQINRQLEEVHGKEVASLVSRGVLQGAIGSETMAKMGEMALEAVERGTTAIGSTRIGQELEMGARKRQFELQKRQLVQSGIMTTAQAQAMAAGVWTGAGRTGEMALVGQQTAQQLGQQWQGTQLGAGLQMWQGFGAQRMSAADMALRASIATQQARTGEYGTRWQAYGDIASSWSDYHLKKNIKHLGTIKGISVILFQYKQEYIPDGNKWHIGVIAQDLMRIHPELISTMPIKGENFYAVNYTSLSAVLGG